MGVAVKRTSVKPAGYSGTPLARKLGIKETSRVALIHQPAHYFQLFTDFPAGARIVTGGKDRKDVIHFFTESASELQKEIKRLRSGMEENGALWISWPKKSSGRETDLNENVIRDIALSNGLVDVKVCAIDEVWSGLKLVIPLKDRRRV